jgi:hypothetical protein
MDWNKLPLEHHHLGVPLGVSKMIYDPIVHLVQTVHLSCSDTNIVSKWIETRFHISHVTSEFHWVRQKWFPSLWYVRRKPYTYLASRLVLSPNLSKQASTWASSPRSTIRCVQNYYWAYGTLGANHAPILSQDLHYLQTDWNELPLEPRHLGELLGVSKMISMFRKNYAPILHRH